MDVDGFPVAQQFDTFFTTQHFGFDLSPCDRIIVTFVVVVVFFSV